MTQRDRQQWSWDPWQTEDVPIQPARSPGKRTLTMGLPAPAVTPAPTPAVPIQQKAGAPAIMQLEEQTALRGQWMNVALRPDLHEAPVQHERLHDAGDEAPPRLPDTGDGRPMAGDVRTRMEHAFGADFSAVRIHEGPRASALGAHAYTQGTDIHFAPGQYDPASQPGQELLGHELAHVVQQSRGQVSATGQARGLAVNDDAALEREADRQGALAARGEGAVSDTPRGDVTTAASTVVQKQDDGSDATGAAGGDTSDGLARFIDDVYQAAAQRMELNIANVELWRAFVLDELSNLELQAQTFATYLLDLENQADSQGQSVVFDAYLDTSNPMLQEAYENVIENNWGGCQYCHTVVPAAEYDPTATTTAGWNTPLQTLDGLTTLSSSSSSGGDPDTLSQQQIQAIVEYLLAPDGETAASTTSVPQVPQVNTSLPTTQPSMNPRAEMDAYIAQIQPVLQPLGMEGYRILPDNLISEFGQRPVADLRAALEEAFDQRLQGYHELVGRIADRSISYLEFQPIVRDLLATADPDVVEEVEDAYRAHRTGQIVVAVGLLVVDLLGVVFPPMAVIGGIGHMVHGASNIDTGTVYNNATGANDVISREQQAMGDLYQATGMMELGGGVVQTGQGISRMRGPALRSVEFDQQLALPEGTTTFGQAGGLMVETLPDGRVMLTNPEFPDLVIYVSGSRVQIYQYMEGQGAMLLGEGELAVGNGTLSIQPVSGSTAAAAIDLAAPPPGLVQVLDQAGFDVTVLGDEMLAIITRADSFLEAGQLAEANAALNELPLGSTSNAAITSALASRHGYTLQELALAGTPESRLVTLTSDMPAFEDAAEIIRSFDVTKDPVIQAMFDKDAWLAEVRIVSQSGRTSPAFGRRSDLPSLVRLPDLFEIVYPDSQSVSRLQIYYIEGSMVPAWSVSMSHEYGHALEAAARLHELLYHNGQSSLWAQLVGNGVSSASDIATIQRYLVAAEPSFGNLDSHRQTTEIGAWEYPMSVMPSEYSDVAGQVANDALSTYGVANYPPEALARPGLASALDSAGVPVNTLLPEDLVTIARADALLAANNLEQARDVLADLSVEEARQDAIRAALARRNGYLPADLLPRSP